MKPVDGPDDSKDHQRHKQEVDNILNEIAVQDCRFCLDHSAVFHHSRAKHPFERLKIGT